MNPPHLLNCDCFSVNARLYLPVAVLLASLGWGVATSCADEPSVNWSIGWDGVVVLGRWTPVVAEFTLDAPAECRLELSALDAEGHTATFVSPTTKLSAGQQQFTGFLQCGRIDSFIRARFVANGVVAHEWTVRPTDTGPLKPYAKLADDVVVTAGRPRGFDQLAREAVSDTDAAVHVVARDRPSSLPTDPRSYDGVHWLVLAGDEPVSSEVSAALREWVGDGGRLLVALPKQVELYQQSSLKNWLPVRVDEQPVMALDLSRLEDIAGRSIRIPAVGRQPVARLAAGAGIALASSRDDPLLYRVPYGFGEVTVLGIDLTKPPLERWGGLPDFIQNLLEIPKAPAVEDRSRADPRRGQLTSTGISDLASQVQACQDYFPQVERPSPWWAIAWMLGLIAVVGPADYLLVHRVLKRPHATWITLPACAIAVAVLGARSAQLWNTGAAHSNQLDVVDIDVATQRFRIENWSTVLSPATQKEDVTIAASGAPWTSLLTVGRQVHPRISWSFIPEAVFSGLYRPGGTEWGRTNYRVFSEDQRIEGLPLLQWSTRTLAAQWSGSMEEMPESLVTSDLQSTGLGRLSGTMTHRFPGALEDWILAYGTRAYRRQQHRDDETSIPWPPGEPFAVEHPLVFQRELRGVLTRAVTRHEQAEGAKNASVREAQTRYDPLGRDPLTVWQLLSFHEAAGGSQYSTLSNHLLADHDLTRQLQLGRAVVFGRLSRSSVAAIERNGSRTSPDRQEVFVRLVIPVTRSLGVIPDLPKFDRE